MALNSDVDIINAACALYGEAPIEDLTSDLGGGQSASLLYEMVVEFNLSLDPFAFAREFRQLSRMDGEVSFSGYDYVYSVPGPYIGLPLYLSDDITDPSRRFDAYVLTGGRIHTSAEPLFAMVLFRPDPNRWPATFRAATIHALAAKLAMATASDGTTHDRFQQIAYGNPSENHRGGMMRAAISENAFANPPRRANWLNNPLNRAWNS